MPRCQEGANDILELQCVTHCTATSHHHPRPHLHLHLPTTHQGTHPPHKHALHDPAYGLYAYKRCWTPTTHIGDTRRSHNPCRRCGSFSRHEEAPHEHVEGCVRAEARLDRSEQSRLVLGQGALSLLARELFKLCAVADGRDLNALDGAAHAYEGENLTRRPGVFMNTRQREQREQREAQ